MIGIRQTIFKKRSLLVIVCVIVSLAAPVAASACTGSATSSTPLAATFTTFGSPAITSSLLAAPRSLDYYAAQARAKSNADRWCAKTPYCEPALTDVELTADRPNHPNPYTWKFSQLIQGHIVLVEPDVCEYKAWWISRVVKVYRDSKGRVRLYIYKNSYNHSGP